MFVQCPHPGGRNGALIIINDRENDAFSDVAGLGGRCDDRYDNDWHDQQRDQPGIIAAYEPEVLEHYRY
jgi:hypothetical protein